MTFASTGIFRTWHFDPYSIMIRQEKDLHCEVKYVRMLHFQYRSLDVLDYEILGAHKLKVLFERNTGPVIFTLQPLATEPLGLWMNLICRRHSPRSPALCH